MTDEDHIACRASVGGAEPPTPVAAWKYHLVRKAILHAVTAAGPEGLPLPQLPGEVRARLSRSDLSRLGSLGWHCTTVMREMEVAGELASAPGPGPQRLILA
ncbi:hypothetical protein HKCCSP123_00315 [Rhodobacterales bacterium HKCCSP123]|nr:hypothetical protein [Rhodobacterales bacterium HKCCSP123]